ncbi:MAG: hypothetical protein KA143_02160 [Saprospiraceae bacterium]|nr:hypothetical protein [Saprospiraceae bacterium]
MGKKLKILICPLNWGLGHATRCAPIIKKLSDLGHTITIAGDGNALEVLKREFPHLEYKELAPLDILYSKYFFPGLILQSIKMIIWMQKDRTMLDQILKEISYDVIISDSRPAIFSSKIKSVFIINQPNPLIPWYYGSMIIKLMLNRIYRKYHEIWIPDIKGINSLGGELINISKHKNIKYIGWLSRLKINNSLNEIPGKILAIISGPEPARSDFQQKLDLILPVELVTLIGGEVKKLEKSTRYISFLEPNDLSFQIETAEYIISRGGYSSLMDLAFSNKKLILVPTPGQTEQEYLAQRLVEKKYAVIWDMDIESWADVKLKSDMAKRFDLQELNRDNDKFLAEALKQLEGLT